MPGARLMDQHFNDIVGVDLKSNKIKRSHQFAQNLKNHSYDSDGTWNKRKGGKIRGEDGPGFGTFTYERIDPDTGAKVSEVVGVDVNGDLLVKKSTTVTITYSGGATANPASLFYDTATSKFRFRTTEDSVIDLDEDLGLGTEVSPVAIATLVSNIDGDANYTASALGDTSVPAAFLELKKDFDLVGNTLTLVAFYWEETHKPDTSKTAFFTTAAEKNNADFENACAVLVNQNIYITDGGFPYKYDGMAYYKAGLPGLAAAPGVAPTFNNGASGLTANATYQWLFEYEYRDKNGNIIRGERVLSSSPTTAGSNEEHADFTVNNLLASEEYPSFGALVNGNQSDSNQTWAITVTSGHNLKAGMYVVLLNKSAVQWDMYLITATTATTITIDKGSVFGSSVDNGDLIAGSLSGSLNANASNPFYNGLAYDGPLQIRVYRTLADGSTFFLTPLGKQTYVDPFNATQAIEDTARDVDLEDEYIPLSYTPKPPRACKYLSLWAGQIVQAGRPYQSTIDELITRDQPNNTSVKYDENNFCAFNSFYWADVETIEGFPIEGLHEESVDTRKNDIITGIAPNQEAFFVFKDRSIALISGEIGLNNIRRDILKSDKGCVAHATIQDVGGMLVFLDGIYGFQSIVAGRLPESIGLQIQPVTKDNPSSGETSFNFKRALAINYEKIDKYICYIPAESLDGSERYPNSNSRVYVLDYEEVEKGVYRNGWLIWDGLNMQGGICVDGDELFWTSRNYVASSFRYDYWKRSNIGDPWDYQDHDQAISWEWFSAWLHYALPGIDKKWIKGIVHSVEDVEGSGFSLDIEQYGNFINGLLLGTSQSLSFNWAADETKRVQEFPLPSSKLTALALKFKNSQDQTNVKITGYELEVEKEYGMELTA